MSNTIDISKLDKAAVLAALYNSSRQQGMDFMHSRGALPMTTEQAAKELKAAEPHGSYFDYLHGRVMKVSLKGDTLSPGLYDRDNGPGAAEIALAPLFAKLETA